MARHFGFTEDEVFAAMDEYGLEEKDRIKSWYDGFIFGEWKDIYNPWSILNYLDKKKSRHVLGEHQFQQPGREADPGERKGCEGIF